MEETKEVKFVGVFTNKSFQRYLKICEENNITNFDEYYVFAGKKNSSDNQTQHNYQNCSNNVEN